MKKNKLQRKSNQSKFKILDLIVSVNKKPLINTKELAKECRRQSQLLKGNPEENEILEYIQFVTNTQ